MEKDKFYKELEKQSKEIEIKLNEEQLNQFYKYMELLLKWNEKINLTAITEPKEIIKKHFIDSLTILKHIKDNENVIDIGTGAGFPGIPLKIANPSIQIILLDSLNKRIKFLNNLIDELKITNIKTIHARIEEVGQNKEYREKFDVVTSRAVSNMNILSEYMIPFAKINGKCLCMKGSEIEEEMKNSKRTINILGGKIQEINTFKLPESDIKRNLVIIKKEKNTPKKYPRRPGIPSKQPLI